MKLNSKFAYPKWKPGEYQEYGFKLYSPGLQYYADQILSGNPFTLIRWGEGEWRQGIPCIPKKDFRNRPDYHNIWKETPEATKVLANAIASHHDSPRYWCAIWHLGWLSHRNWSKPIQAWMKANGLWNVRWHDGWVWRRAIQEGTFYPVVEAIQKQSLPVCVVGPNTLADLKSRLPITLHIEIHRWRAYYDMDMIEKSMLDFGNPALWILCGGGPVKIVANKLFPLIGDHSYMIDFGASWEGLLGYLPRTYFQFVKPETIEVNWHGAS